MEKETVLEIEFIQVWDKWAWRMTKIELPRGVEINEIDEGISIIIERIDDFWRIYEKDRYMLDENTLITSETKHVFEIMIKAINKKYGKPKRWRAERNGGYYCINDYGIIYYTTDDYVSADNDRYEIGNYFKTQEQAKKALERVKKVLQEVEENVEM
ncbi:hypothetical protein A2U10_07080 [Fusobacterium necrophorum subsp. funduliforme]|jgi:hypothetical protein|uniref:hypothetical protein n=1 Tax=Fusobacterium necrophorum TaxID=859 RepID=UPI00078688D7|nr:hypothetical protein [Fusobacterium necrophorum]KYM38489.1 hypothetical protein A2U10_07080 [Fusobacterium necrophorum subsp. funduliforme]